MIQFGIGKISVAPVGGNLATNPTPYGLLTIQDYSVDIDQKLVELQGQNKIADDIAPSDMTVKGKITVGRPNYDMWNQIMFGETRSTGGVVPVPDEEHAIPASTPFTVTVTGSANFSEDRGVQYLGNPPVGNQQNLTRISSGTPTTGQYLVSSGTYTFASADEGVSVLISYTKTVTTGYTVTVLNHLQGYGPVFSLLIPQQYYLAEDSSTQSIPSAIYLPKCRCTKLSIEGKRNDYLKPPFEFQSFCDASGNAMYFVNSGSY